MVAEEAEVEFRSLVIYGPTRMIKAIQELASVIPPPSSPIVTIDSHERLIELSDVFGTRLPEDYIQFQRTYGEGWFFSVSHKMSAGLCVFGNAYRVGGNGSTALRHASPKRLHELRALKEARPKRVPLPLFCEPLGLLPWGNTTNEIDLCWRVHGQLVDNWPVIALKCGTGEYEQFECCMAEFLTGIISGKFSSQLLPKHFPGRKGVGWAVVGGGEVTLSNNPASAD